MGTTGLVCNIVVLFWTAFTFVMYSFPYYYPVLAGSMNYVSVVYAIVFISLIGYWHGRGKYQFRSKEERDTNAMHVTEEITHVKMHNS